MKITPLHKVPEVMGVVPDNWTRSGWIRHLTYIAENATFEDVRRAYASALERLGVSVET